MSDFGLNSTIPGQDQRNCTPFVYTDPTTQGETESYDFLMRPLEAYLTLVTSVVCTFVGLIGNSLVVIVYRKCRSWSTTDVVILTLAVVDLFFSVIMIPLTPVFAFTEVETTFRQGIVGAVFLLETFSIFLLVCIALERLYVVYKPTTRREPQNAAVCVIAGVVFTVAFGVTASFSEVVSTYGLVLYVLMAYATLVVSYGIVFILLRQHNRRVTPMLATTVRESSARGKTSSSSTRKDTTPKQSSHNGGCKDTASSEARVSASARGDVHQNAMETPSEPQNTINSVRQREMLNTVSRQVTLSRNSSTANTDASQANMIVPALSGHRRKEQTKIAKMTCTITVVFVVAFFPVLLTTLKLTAGTSTIPYIFLFINHVANPVIYSFGSSKFREGVRKTFKGCVRKSL